MAGIEVILDVVFNHTDEGNELGPTHSFRGIDNRTFYLLDQNNLSTYLNSCHRRGLPLGIERDNLYMEDAELLAGGRERADEKERREKQRADHEGIVAPQTQ